MIESDRSDPKLWRVDLKCRHRIFTHAESRGRAGHLMRIGPAWLAHVTKPPSMILARSVQAVQFRLPTMSGSICSTAPGAPNAAWMCIQSFRLIMKIGALSAKTGLTPSRIRYYEGIGLLWAVERMPNGYRLYGSDAIAALNLIIMAQKIGFALEEIRHLAPDKASGWDHALTDQTFARKIKEIEVEEAKLVSGKARLIAVRTAIAARPEGIDCDTNEARILSLIDTD